MRRSMLYTMARTVRSGKKPKYDRTLRGKNGSPTTAQPNHTDCHVYIYTYTGGHTETRMMSLFL